MCPPTGDTGQPQPGHSTAQHSPAGQARLGDCGGAGVLALVRTQRPRLLGLGALCSEAGPADAVLGAAPPQQHNNNPSIIYTAQLGAQHSDPTITENIRLESESPTYRPSDL